MPSQGYQSWSLEELKNELRKRKARISGRKRELVTRLEFLDATKAKEDDVVDEEFSMTVPSGEIYKDLHGGMKASFPKLTPERIVDYLAQYDKKLEKKSIDLYKERFVRCLRVTPPSDLGHVFIHASVWAEMKKASSYKVDIKLSADAVAEECQCECGAGQGPSAHCKHVACVLYGLSCFCKNGTILTELTCTQVLQTFHRTKAYKGSPLKSEDLQGVRGKEACVYDPRPANFRQTANYQSSFRNLCINFASQHKHETTMPVLQLFPPANLRAAAYDHHYFRLSPEEYFLKKIILFEVTPFDVAYVERLTRGQSRTEFWKEHRQYHITSSNFGTICKATERRDMQKLLASLINPSTVSTAPLRYGRQNEPVAVEKFEQSRKITTDECGLFVSLEHPFLAASPDRIVSDEVLLEIKCPYVSRAKTITPATVPYLHKVNGVYALDQSHDYYYQIQGQLLCAKRSLCLLYVHTSIDGVTVEVPRNDAFIETMVNKLESFYKDHFLDAVLNKFLYKNYDNLSFTY